MSKFYGNYSGHFGDHFKECKEYFKESEIVMLALTGSQNYGLDTKDSDIDAKLTVLPCKEDIFLISQQYQQLILGIMKSILTLKISV